MWLSLGRHCLQNHRGLAHFAESSEQNVPVPLSRALRCEGYRVRRGGETHRE